jgi:hypothetical protein
MYIERWLSSATVEMKKYIFLYFFIGFFTFATPLHAAAGELGLQPKTGTIAIGQSLSVSLTADVGTVNKLNIASVTLTFDAGKLLVNSGNCTVGTGFQGIFGQSPCTVTVNDQVGTITIMEQATNIEGPSGNVLLATILLTGKTDGQVNVTIASYELTVKDSSGQSVTYDVTGTVNGSYLVGVG